MKQSFSMMFLLFVFVFFMTGCSLSKKTDTNSIEVNITPTLIPSAPTKISAEDAKKMMDNSKDVIILDVRTPEEFDAGHIEGAILLPDSEVTDKAKDVLKDKSETILVYCRSGRRSALASQELCDLGYTSVYDFGGIINWPYDVVTE